MFAHRAVEEHEVLQKILQTEPDRLLPQLTVDSHRVLGFITRFLEPYLERETLRAGVDPHEASEYVARVLLFLHQRPGPLGPDRPGPGPPPRENRGPRRHPVTGERPGTSAPGCRSAAEAGPAAV